MTLRDANIDRWGAVFGPGEIKFPSDPGGRFVASDERTVRMDVSDRGFATFVATSTRRDPETGYVVAETEGPTVAIWGEAAQALIRCLRFPPKEQRLFALDSPGRMHPENGGDSQPLSDLRFTLSNVDGGLGITFSAALHSAPWNRPGVVEADAWSEVEKPRLEVALTLDAATQAIRFGGVAHVLDQGTPQPAPPYQLTSVAKVDLATTPIGFNRSYYAATPDGGLVSIGESIDETVKTIYLSAPPRQLRRYPSGLIDNDSSWPRISLYGMDLGVIFSALHWSRSTAYTLSGANVGQVAYSGWNSDGPGDSARILEAHLDIDLGATGLQLAYRVQPDGRATMQDVIVIPWEGLILRTTLLRQHQQALLEEDSIGTPEKKQ